VRLPRLLPHPAAAPTGVMKKTVQSNREDLTPMRVAFLVAPEGVEQVELTEPWDAVLSAGGTPQLVSTHSGRIQAFNHLDKSDSFPVDKDLDSVGPADYDALVLPGGVANPDALRMDRRAVEFVRGFFGSGKPVAAICHAPWTLVEADVVRGRTLTSWPSLRTDIRNAGGTWVDEQVKTCTGGPNTLVTSRKPDDLKAFCDTFIQVFKNA
jgi:protease I